MINMKEHTSVLLNEAVQALIQKASGFYVDGTFGRGGHAKAVLKALGPEGKLLSFDKDPEAVEVGRQLMTEESRFEIKHGSFKSLSQYMPENSVDGVLLDLGVSSPQLDNPSRGFSFLHDGPLDMRMNPDVGMSAAQWIAQADEEEMRTVFKQFGEERYAKRIAKAIIVQRAVTPIIRTVQLADIVKAANPAWEKNKHPATRVFQAIRIYVNDELADIESALDIMLETLKPGGRLVVISFHSLEDRMVKKFIRRHERGDPYPVKLPIREDKIVSRMKACGKPVKTSEDEFSYNRRARSAIMRVAEKLV